MDSSLQKLNRVQDLFCNLGYEPITLPKIVVVGAQSSGKSSVLESLVQRSILPRGSGIVTRCPLVLQLINCPLDDKRRQETDYEEWGEFLHAPDEVFGIDKIRAEIEAQTLKVAGDQKGIEKQPITLKIFSARVVNLTLIDLPGITKVPVADQPKDIETMILELIDSYIKDPCAIILAVLPANTDMSTNDCLKIAQRVDPEGDRTLAVVTKVDIMDAGTDARSVLKGEVIPVKLGIIGVVNRSQQDINNEKDIQAARVSEKNFFIKKYPDLASQHGSDFLAKRLSMLLSDHVSKFLPKLEVAIDDQLRNCREHLDVCGEVITDNKTFLIKTIPETSRKFEDLVLLGSRDVSCQQLLGGSKICHLMHQQLEQTFKKFSPYETYDRESVIASIKQSRGLKQPLFFSDPAFENLIQPLIMKMENPSLDCLQNVKRELKDVSRMCISKDVSLRFPRLKDALYRILVDVIEEKSVKAENMIKDIILMEAGHVTYYRLEHLTNRLKDLLDQPDEKDKSKACDKIKFRKRTSSNLDNGFKSIKDFEMSRETLKIREELFSIAERDVPEIIAIGEMLDEYFNIVRRYVEDAVAKVIVKFLIKQVIQSVTCTLTDKLLKGDIDHLFEESVEVTTTRNLYESRQKVLLKAREVLFNISTLDPEKE